MKPLSRPFKFIHLLSIYTLFFSSLCFAVVDNSIETTLKTSAASTSSVDKILELSGMIKQVAQIPSQIQQGLAQQHAASNSLPQAQYDLMFASVDKSFSQEAIMAAIRDVVQHSLNQDEADLLLNWYESDLGKAITQAEVAAGEPEAVAEMMAGAAELLQDTDRLALAQRLDRLLNMSDITMQLFIDTTVGVTSAFSIASQPEQAVETDLIRAQFENVKDQMRTSVEQMTWASYIYAFRDIDLDKLQAYEEFLSQDVPLRFNRVTLDTFIEGFNEGITIWARDLARIFVDSKK